VNDISFSSNRKLEHVIVLGQLYVYNERVFIGAGIPGAHRKISLVALTTGIVVQSGDIYKYVEKFVGEITLVAPPITEEPLEQL